MIRAARAHVWLDANRASENFSDSAAMAIQGTTRYSYLKFGLPSAMAPVPGRRVTVTAATLRVYTRGSWGVTPTLSVSRVDRVWVPGRVTWNTRPGVFSAEVTKSQSSAAEANEWSFDVTTFVQAIANGAVWNGLRISTTYATGPLWLYSTAARDAVLPTLEVEWSEAPRAPVDLSPSGGRSVSLTKPVLQCDFVDRAGARRMQALHFQVNTSNVWATPLFDSGTVAKSEPELDLATTTITALTNGTVYWWRGRVQDAAGLWSEWSDGVQFRRDTKGTLAITNPAVSPNNKVDEWTPPILATLTGRTLEAFSVAISDAADPGFDLYESGRIADTTVAHTLPKGVLTDDRTYEVRVRAWDTLDRESTPGDPPFLAAFRTFTFREDVTVDPVANLTATQVGAAPWVDVSFTRASAPDKFVLKRNGRVVESGILPGDVTTGGTGYTIRDDDTPPHELVTYRVQAVVNGKTSANNPGVDVTVRPEGVWLRDRSRNLEVVIYGDDPVAWESPDQASDYQPLGSAETIRVTQGLSAYRGTVTGLLTADLGVSMKALDKRMMLFKARPNEILTMTTGTRTIRCRIGDVATWPTDDPRDFGVSFTFRQCGLLEWNARL